MIPNYIIVHTAAAGYAGKCTDCSAKDIDKWHKQNGWRCIGYHGVIRMGGAFEPGRKETETGAHATPPTKEFADINKHSLGICMSGHGDICPWTNEQKETFLRIVGGWCKKYNIPVENVLGHRELGSNKSCPGSLIDMNGVRKTLHAYLSVTSTIKEVPGIVKFFIQMGLRYLNSAIVRRYIPEKIRISIALLFKDCKDGGLL